MSKIEWTDDVWNPVTGCTKISAGCKNCYAETLAKRRLPHGGFTDRPFTEVRCHPERLEIPLRWKRPRRVFVNSMSDLFHESVPDEFIDQVFSVMALCHRHTFQVLTKRPERMRRYFGPSPELEGMTRDCLVEGGAQKLLHDRTGEDASMTLAVHWPLPNVWLGVSCENQEAADERIPLLLQAPAAVRFISAEPLLGPIDAATHPPSRLMSGIAWVIVGGESGPKARPCDIAWIRSLRDQCKGAGVACFVKQLGARRGACPECGHPDDLHGHSRIEGCQYGDGSDASPICGCRKQRGEIEHNLGDMYEGHAPMDRKGGDMSEWPADLRVREFPEVRP